MDNLQSKGAISWRGFQHSAIRRQLSLYTFYCSAFPSSVSVATVENGRARLWR